MVVVDAGAQKDWGCGNGEAGNDLTVEDIDGLFAEGGAVCFVLGGRQIML